MRIALATIGTMGDILPFARLARVLAARGHEVVVHTWPMYREQFASAGVRFQAAGAAVSPAELLETSRAAVRARTAVEQLGCFVELFHLRRAEAQLATACDALAGADLAVINVIDQVAHAAALRLEARWVGWHSRPAGPSGDPAWFAEQDRVVSERLSRLTGVPLALRVFRQHARLHNLVAASRVLLGTEPHPFDDSAPGLIAGDWAEPGEGDLDAEIARFLAAGEGPAVFATFGTVPDPLGRTAALVEACRSVGVRLVLQTTEAVAPSPAVLVVPRRLSYANLFGAFAGVVHHGGAATTHAVCRAGVPSLVIPHFGDQYYWADLIGRRGCGPLAIPHLRCEPAVLAERLHALVHFEAYRRTVGGLASALAAEDGVPASVELLERLQNRSE